MYTIQLLLHVVVCYCVRCVYVTNLFTVGVEPFVPGHVPLSRLCAGPRATSIMIKCCTARMLSNMRLILAEPHLFIRRDTFL